MEVDTEAPPTDIRKVLRVLRRRKWWVAVTVVLAVGLSLASSSRSPKLYAAVSRVSLGETTFFATADFAIGGGGRSTPERQMATQLQLAQSPPVEERVSEALGQELRKLRQIQVQSVGETDIIQFVARSTDPGLAASAANAFAEAYVEYRQEQAAAALSDKAEELEQLQAQTTATIASLDQELSDLNLEIAGLEARIANGGGISSPGVPTDVRAKFATATSKRSSLLSQRESASSGLQSLRSRVDQLDVAAAIQRDSTTQLVSTANAPRAPYSPTPVRDATVAGGAGLLLGLALAFGRDALDDRVETEDEVVDAAAGLPVLGSLPALKRRFLSTPSKLPALDAPSSAAAEALRGMRTSTEFVAVANDVSVLLVTSSAGREGKTTISANLAVSFALAGYDVIVVDLDLRRPRLGELLGMGGGAGLTGVLRGRATVEDALQDVAVSGGRLRVLPSGELPPNPAELAGSDRTGKLIEHLRAISDLVIIDTPPVGVVTDAAVAARWADGIVVVARAGVTSAQRLVGSIDQIRQSGVRLLGVMFNGTRSRLQPRYHYHYYRMADVGAGDASGDWESVVAPGDEASERWAAWAVSGKKSPGVNGEAKEKDGPHGPTGSFTSGTDS